MSDDDGLLIGVISLADVAQAFASAGAKFRRKYADGTMETLVSLTRPRSAIREPR
ncbi:MAG: hypothetical protein AAF726_18035 [Planctomycetota bacterium]